MYAPAKIVAGLARVQERWQFARSLATPATWAVENHSRSCQRFQKS